MKKIPLSGKYGKGKFVLVDDKDFDVFSRWQWYAVKGKRTLYARRGIMKNGYQTTLKMHRSILDAKEGEIVDHIDGNGLNNQRGNLRFATNSENVNNTYIRKTNKSGYKGVSWHKASKMWIAQIVGNEKKLHLGIFISKEEAAKAYNKAAVKYHGVFARINVIR